MIIDFHTHIFPDGIAPKTIPFLEQRSGIQANTDGMLKGLLRAMEETNVDVSVVHPVVTKPSQFDTVNQFAKMVNDSCDGKVISFGGIHPDCEDYKGKLEYIKELGLPGIKLHPDYQGVFIDDERYTHAAQVGLQRQYLSLLFLMAKLFGAVLHQRDAALHSTANSFYKAVTATLYFIRYEVKMVIDLRFHANKGVE